MNYFYNPVRTIQGAGSLGQLPELAAQAAAGSRILLLLCRQELQQNQVIQHLEQQEQVKTIFFTQSNPDVAQLYALYDQTKDWGAGLVVAVGGGSVLDVGKSLCCLYGGRYSSVQQLREAIQGKTYPAPSCPWIGVPTTAGTGSETTCWATIWNPENNAKYSIDTPQNYAYAAVADPELLYSMPIGLAVSSALDAAAHAAESYWAKASNLVSKSLAVSAIQQIMGQIGVLLDDPENAPAHDAMSKGSMLAGLAFSNTRTTACHSLSYPLTMRYHIPHGAAVAILLAPVMQFNRQAGFDPAPLLRAFGVDNERELGRKIETMLTRAGLPARLSGWGAKQSDIAELAKHSITKGRADNNPAQITVDAAAGLLASLL